MARRQTQLFRKTEHCRELTSRTVAIRHRMHDFWDTCNVSQDGLLFPQRRHSRISVLAIQSWTIRNTKKMFNLRSERLLRPKKLSY